MILETLKVPLELDKSKFDGGLDSAIGTVKKGMGLLAGAVVAGMTAAVNATMDWATELDTLGDIMDGTNEDFAALAFVARKSGVGIDKLAKANVILEKGLLKSNKTLDTTGKKLKEYGINVKDANGNVKSSIELTDEIAKKYAELGTQQERVNFLTELYGKSGADLVDFFDTLAQEGGIDRVTDKVKAFGLAIDPSRYEQFNRNLEELKLIGLGLAVSFTEKVMPALEGFLGWVTESIQGLKTGKITFADLAKEIDVGIAAAIDDVDWDALGAKFGEEIDAAFTKGSRNVNVPKSLEALGNGIYEFFRSAIGEEALAGWDKASKDLDREMRKWANGQPSIFDYWGQQILDYIKKPFVDAYNWIMSQLDHIGAGIETALGGIAKIFFTQAMRWASQMIRGFLNNSPGLMAAVQDITNDINNILKQIQTHFSLTFSVGEVGSKPGDVKGSGGGGGGGGRLPPAMGKASGGPVLAGQLYRWNERGQEFFRPAVNGTIVPAGQPPVTVMVDEDRLAKVLGRVLGEQMQKGFAR